MNPWVDRAGDERRVLGNQRQVGLRDKLARLGHAFRHHTVGHRAQQVGGDGQIGYRRHETAPGRRMKAKHGQKPST
ncbi:hypothetical protein [Ottowia sp.]|jgi:hypothetical protein|uniref:hypothetical protein n=1 Tax=Ottowia sp. TaxID=1898956 RepID=UPI0025D0A1EB|nr:hypothetical protein [Ottowia sp.]MBK6613043.1 hypothetical protein [Ottowia sp.]MBK6747845.1 hypothetical protein [Ottowia sp.]